MSRVRPPVRSPADESVLPPLDDDGEAPSVADDAFDFGTEDASLDDALADNLESLFDLDETPESDPRAFADDASDADVGDLAEDIDTPEDKWSDDESPSDSGEDHVVQEMPSLADDEDGDGLDDMGHDVIDESRFDALSDDVDEGADDEVLADTLEPERSLLPAFALPKPEEAVVSRIQTEGMVLAAATREDRIVLVGDGVFGLSPTALDGPRVRTARRLGPGSDEWISSVACVDHGMLAAATVSGNVLRSEDGGATWIDVAALGGEDVGKAAVELVAEGGSTKRLWARAHGGGWFRSDDGGRQWDGPVLPQPVRASAALDRGDGVLVATSGWASQLLRCVDGTRWDAIAMKLPAPPTAMVCAGDAWALAFGRKPGLVTLDGGRTVSSWPLLAGATAMAWCTADDGALQLIAAVHDEAGDRATIVRAGLDANGQARGACRLVDVDGVFERTFDSPGEDGDERVEQLLLLDPAGRRVLFVTPRGVAVLFAG